MKIFAILPVAALVLSGWTACYGQDLEPEVPGDHFSLEGALDLFKRSESPEEFERLLNSSDSKVNNLDLNGDGYIDYIRVYDRYEGNVHAFILQAVVSDTEYQDVAVIELEKLSNGKAVLQIVGDEDVYGVETIIEPTREVRTYAGSTSSRTVVNVWAWPSVQYVYGPYYSAWVSPWSWHRRPVWWHTWRPVAYVHYHPIWRPYRHYYVPCHTRRVVYAYELYRPYRTTSVIVHDRHRHQLAHYRSSRHDGSRYARDRYDGRRTDDRSRSSMVPQRGRESGEIQRIDPSRRLNDPSGRGSYRDRTSPVNGERREAAVRREDFVNRRPASPQQGRDVRQQVSAPELAPARSYEADRRSQREISPQRRTPAAGQPPRQVSRERSVSPTRQPEYSRPQRNQPTYGSPSTVERNRAERPHAVNRSRASGGGDARPSRGTEVQRSRGTMAPARPNDIRRGRD